MPRRGPSPSKIQERQFWSWTRLTLTRQLKDKILLILLHGLNQEGLLRRDFRRTTVQNQVDTFLGRAIECTPEAFRHLYARRGKELRIRLRTLLSALKQRFFRNPPPSAFSRLENLPAEMVQHIAQFLRFGGVYNLSATSIRMRYLLAYERRRRLNGKALASVADYHRVITFGRFGEMIIDEDEADLVDQPLYWAVANGWTGVIYAFMERGVPPIAVSLYGTCMLTVAIQNKQRESAKLLLFNDANVDILDPREQRTPLFLALEACSDIAHDILAAYGAILHTGESADLLDIAEDSEDTSEWLREEGIDIESIPEEPEGANWVGVLQVIPDGDI